MKKRLLGTYAAATLGLVATGCKTADPEKDALYASLPYEVPEESFLVKRCDIPMEVTEIKQVDANHATTNTVFKMLPYAKYTIPGVAVNIVDCIANELKYTYLKVSCDLKAVGKEAENHPLKDSAAYKFTQGTGEGFCWAANVIRFVAIEVVGGVSDGLGLGLTTNLYSEREKAAIAYYRDLSYRLYLQEEKDLGDYRAIERTIFTNKDGKIQKLEITDPRSELSMKDRKAKAKRQVEEVEGKGKTLYDAWNQPTASGEAPAEGKPEDQAPAQQQEKAQPEVSMNKPVRIIPAAPRIASIVNLDKMTLVRC